MSKFTGDESAADLLRITLDEFSASQPFLASPVETKIYYQNGVPYLKFYAAVKDDLGEFVCVYRLDKMMLRVLPECERIYDEVDQTGLFGERDDRSKAKTVRYLAAYSMNMMLRRLMVLQLVMFRDLLDDTRFLAACSLFNAMATAFANPQGRKVQREARNAIRTLLDKAMDVAVKQKRELLVPLLNSTPILESPNIPTSAGRPKGSTKPDDVKAQEAEGFEKEIEETIKKLLSANGKFPTKTAVAKALKIGGLNPHTGIDSSLAAFRNKLGRLNVDYNAIAERMKLNK